MYRSEPLANKADRLTQDIEDPRQNRTAINKIFREADESHLYPIKGKFNATDRAIRRAQKFSRQSSIDMAGLEYSLFLKEEISRIVNNEV